MIKSEHKKTINSLIAGDYMNDITSTSLSAEKELKKDQAKENSKKLNDLSNSFSS